MSDKMKTRLGEVISLAPWTALDLKSKYVIIEHSFQWRGVIGLNQQRIGLEWKEQEQW